MQCGGSTEAYPLLGTPALSPPAEKCPCGFLSKRFFFHHFIPLSEKTQALFSSQKKLGSSWLLPMLTDTILLIIFPTKP